MCISDHATQETMYDFMTHPHGWQLMPPKLIISIVGGARSFKDLSPKISRQFNHGLLDIAVSTGKKISVSSLYISALFPDSDGILSIYVKSLDRTQVVFILRLLESILYI